MIVDESELLSSKPLAGGSVSLNLWNGSIDERITRFI